MKSSSRGGLRAKYWVKTTSANSSSGFTIVETLIVLAVTAALFVSAAAVIGGKQNTTQFSQGVRDVESRIQKVINEVSVGYYSNNGAVSCELSAGNLILSTAATEQGKNKDCVFLGKVVQFAVTGSDNELFNVYSLVGQREFDGRSVSRLVDAKPRLVARADGEPNSIPESYEEEIMAYGLTVVDMYYDNDTSKQIGAVGFVSRLEGVGGQNGSQQVDMIAVPDTTRQRSKVEGVTQINNSFRAPAGSIPPGAVHSTPAATNPASGVQLCLRSGGTEQSALLTIGGQGRQLTVSSVIKNSTDCA